MSENQHVDLVVIGLGPGGEHLATEAARAGMTVVGIDERLVGGECPYYGCIPSKMMIRAANSLAEAHRVGALAGGATAAPDFSVVAARIRDEATDDWDDTVAVERLEQAGVRFVRGHGRLVGEGVVEVGGTRFVAGTGVVLNTGTAPAAPPVDGLADTPYWTNRDALRATEAPNSLVVMGGGAIGAELAQAFSRFGTRVSVVEAAPRILALEEPEASEVVARAFAADGIQVLAGAKVSAVAHADGRFTLTVAEAEGEDLTLDADRLLVAAGRRPNLADLGLDDSRPRPRRPVARDRRADARRREAVGRRRHHRQGRLHAHVDVPGRHRAARPHRRGRAVGELPRGPAGHLHRPRGRGGRDDRAAGTRRRASTSAPARRPSRQSTRGWIHGPGGEGVVKVVEDAAAGHLVGATSVGPTGGEVLSMLATAVHARVPTAVLREQVLAYPTFHRAVSSALADLDG